MEDIRQKIVSQMQAYGVFLQDHAEDIVGKLDETYLYENGISVSFDIGSKNYEAEVKVAMRYLPMEVVKL